MQRCWRNLDVMGLSYCCELHEWKLDRPMNYAFRPNVTAAAEAFMRKIGVAGTL
jgi:hypothetical protein